jgi:hypothetical protein
MRRNGRRADQKASKHFAGPSHDALSGASALITRMSQVRILQSLLCISVQSKELANRRIFFARGKTVRTCT